LVRKGQPWPDGGGSIMGAPEYVLNNAGQVAFWSASSSVGGVERIFRTDGSMLVEIARTGQDAPNGSGRFSQFALGPQINDAGRVAFTGYLSSPVGGGIFLGDGTTSTQLARYGEALLDGNGQYAGTPWFSMRLNELGHAAFFANFSNTLGGASDNTGILRGDGASLVTIVRKGQMAPDGNGAFFDFTGLGFTAPAALNDSGQVAFDARLTGTAQGNSDDYGIFRSDGATLVQVVREGQLAPDGNGRFVIHERPALNDAGQLAFRASLTGTSGGASDNTGIFFFDDALGLLQVVRTGDAFLGSTITALSFAPPERWGDEGSGLNKSGVPRVAYFFRLADSREGIAVWTLVPEPTSVPLLLVAMLSMLHRRSVRPDRCTR
ncbi:MAG TPA: choice-of-anchor tandem repeat NxxGxxAF-containing protein, partial [Lacipirellulaceae bacterium]|nr:choice-of-anchor tandem repeat NxxGxxAF-containing protein [Lacipirellulaceae bacterium]